MDLLIWGLLAVAGYAYLSSPASPTAAQGSPTPVATALLTGSVSTTPAGTSSPGTTMAMQPVTRGGIPRAANVASIVARLCSGNFCTGKSGANKRGYLQQFFTEAVTERLLPDPMSDMLAMLVLEPDAQTNCAGYAASPGASGISQGISMAQAGVSAGFSIAAAAGAAIPVAGLVIGPVLGLASTITGIFSKHHAAAVRGEQQDICSSVGLVNTALDQSDQYVLAGNASPSEASSALDQIAQEFYTLLHTNTTFKTGDALWAYYSALTGIVTAKKADYAAMAA
jgi:hypothetical protein